MLAKSAPNATTNATSISVPMSRTSTVRATNSSISLSRAAESPFASSNATLHKENDAIICHRRMTLIPPTQRAVIERCGAKSSHVGIAWRGEESRWRRAESLHSWQDTRIGQRSSCSAICPQGHAGGARRNAIRYAAWCRSRASSATQPARRRRLMSRAALTGDARRLAALVIRNKRRAGADMRHSYKEGLLGGLAVKTCPSVDASRTACEPSYLYM